MEVTAGDVATTFFVVPMTVRLDPVHDRPTGTGPANQTLAVKLLSGGSYYITRADVDAVGIYTVTTSYQGGNPMDVDIWPEDCGVLRYTHADGNHVYLHFGLPMVCVHENHNRVHGVEKCTGLHASLLAKRECQGHLRDHQFRLGDRLVSGEFLHFRMLGQPDNHLGEDKEVE